MMLSPMDKWIKMWKRISYVCWQVIIGRHWFACSFKLEDIFSRHPEIRSPFRRLSSAIDFPQTSARRSSLAFRKSEQVNLDNARRLSLLEMKANGEQNRNLRSLVVKVILSCFLLFAIFISRDSRFFPSMIRLLKRLLLIYYLNKHHLIELITLMEIVTIRINYEQHLSLIDRHKFIRKKLEILFSTK